MSLCAGVSSPLNLWSKFPILPSPVPFHLSTLFFSFPFSGGPFPYQAKGLGERALSALSAASGVKPLRDILGLKNVFESKLERKFVYNSLYNLGVKLYQLSPERLNINRLLYFV